MSKLKNVYFRRLSIPFGFSGASKHISNTIYLKIGYFRIENKNHIVDKSNKHFNYALLYNISFLH